MKLVEKTNIIMYTVKEVDLSVSSSLIFNHHTVHSLFYIPAFPDFVEVTIEFGHTGSFLPRKRSWGKTSGFRT